MLVLILLILKEPGDRSMTWAEMVVVGRVARSHGNKGEVVINLETDFPERRFQNGNVLYGLVDGEAKPFLIEGVRFHGGRPVVGLKGIDSMNAAEALAAAELRVPEAELVTLPQDTYYRYQLIGSVVETISGTVVGTVTAVEGAIGAQRLLVRPSGDKFEIGTEIEVPLAEPICVRIDTVEKRILVDPPDGLLELNERG